MQARLRFNRTKWFSVRPLYYETLFTFASSCALEETSGLRFGTIYQVLRPLVLPGLRCKVADCLIHMYYANGLYRTKRFSVRQLYNETFFDFCFTLRTRGDLWPLFGTIYQVLRPLV
jgi:hypothetical protein